MRDWIECEPTGMFCSQVTKEVSDISVRNLVEHNTFHEKGNYKNGDKIIIHDRPLTESGILVKGGQIVKENGSR